MVTKSLLKKASAVLLFFVMFFSGFPPSSFISSPFGRGTVVDETRDLSSASTNIPSAEAAAKTKTVVFLVGSIVSTTVIAANATTTYTFTISLPDMVPDTQPIRSAYISYNTWQNSTNAVTSSSFTLNTQSGAVQTLPGAPKLTGLTTEQQLSIRLDATSAMRTLIGNASGTYAMVFTAKLSGGPTRVAEGAELYVTYDYVPLAPKQINTVYQWVYSTSTILSTTTVTSPTFNLNLPESGATTTFTSTSGSSTNDFWVEYRGFIPSSTAVTAAVGWNVEATSAVTFAQTTQQFSFFIIVAPKTTSTSPSAANTFKINSAVATSSIMAPTAIAIATYSFNFASSTKLRKTIQVLLMQSTSSVVATTINTTSTINIPETSPSSTDAFLLGRLAFSSMSSPGINAYATTSGCTAAAATTFIATGTVQTKNTGYLTAMVDIQPSSTINAAGNWNFCSTFARSATANIPGLELFLSYDYSNNFASGTRFNTNVSFLGQSNMTTGTTFAATGINASIVNASTTANYSWLDSEFDDNAAVAQTNQTSTLGIGTVNGSYAFPSRNSAARLQGSTWSATSSSGFSTNVTTTVQCSTACIDDATYNVFAFTDMAPGNFSLAHYHWRVDNGSETGATAAALEDSSTTIASGTIARLRIEINNTGDATTSAAFRLEYQANATTGAWTQLATSTVGTAAWRMATSSFVTDGTPTTDIATSTGGTTDANIFLMPGEVVASTSRNQTNNFILTGTQFTEDEFAITPTVNIVTTSTYFFRVTNAGTALSTYATYPTALGAGVTFLTLSSMLMNGGSSITLIPNATTSVSITASTTPGTNPISFATSTIYRTSVGKTCSAEYDDCYQLASSSCAFTNSTTTVTCTAYLQYFADSTGNASSSFPSDSWTGAITLTDTGGGTTTATTSAVNVNVLTAINIASSSVNYGTVNPGSDTGSNDQVLDIQNAGNSSNTIQLSGTVLKLGVNQIATSSQHFATSTFTFGGSEQPLSGSLTTVSGFIIPPAPSGPTWLTSATLLPAGLETPGTIMDGNTMYVIGGDLEPNAPTATVYYATLNGDGTINAFTSTSPLPYGLARFGTPAIHNGFVYLSGGWESTDGVTSSTTSTVLFAPINDDGSLGTWTSTTPLPGILDLSAEIAVNNYLYVIGGSKDGSTGNATSATLFAKFNGDGTIGNWSTTTPLPYKEYKAFGAANNGIIYMPGGEISPGGLSTSSFVYATPSSSTGAISAWTVAPPLSAQTEGYGFTINDNMLYIIGGDGTGSGGDTTTVQFAPLDTNGNPLVWDQSLPKLPKQSSRNTAVAYNGFLYDVAGLAGAGLDTSTIHLFSLSNRGIFWGLQVQNAIPTGTYNGTTTVNVLFSP